MAPCCAIVPTPIARATTHRKWSPFPLLRHFADFIRYPFNRLQDRLKLPVDAPALALVVSRHAR